MENVRIGLVGLGIISKVHFDYFQFLKGGILAAVCDIDEKRGQKASQDYGVPYFKDYKEMFAGGKIDAAVVLTDHYSHYPICMEAFRRGLHVLCEKPLTVKSSEGEKMVEEADKRGLVLAVDFGMHAYPAHQAFQRIIRERIGKILRAEFIDTTYLRTMTYYKSSPWRSTWKGEGGGVLMNQSPHTLDLIYWCLGLPRTVKAELAIKYHDIEVEDDATLLLGYDGFSARFYMNTWETPGLRFSCVVGDRGTVTISPEGARLCAYNESTLDYIQHADKLFDAPAGKWENIEVPKVEHSGYYVMAQNFVNVLLKKESALLVSGKDALGSLYIANASVVSHLKKKEICMKDFKPSFFDRALNQLIQKKAKI